MTHRDDAEMLTFREPFPAWGDPQVRDNASLAAALRHAAAWLDGNPSRMVFAVTAHEADGDRDGTFSVWEVRLHMASASDEDGSR